LVCNIRKTTQKLRPHKGSAKQHACASTSDTNSNVALLHQQKKIIETITQTDGKHTPQYIILYLNMVQHYLTDLVVCTVARVYKKLILLNQKTLTQTLHSPQYLHAPFMCNTETVSGHTTHCMTNIIQNITTKNQIITNTYYNETSKPTKERDSSTNHTDALIPVFLGPLSM
jgi:hypothetical protein